MDPQTFMEITAMVKKLRMYPYFDIANYILMCTIVREDNPAQSHGAQPFSRKHPLSCWVASMLLCFAGSIIGNLLLGEPCILPFKNHQDVITASVVWYLINYSPFDLVYKICKFLPFKIVICVLKEVRRAFKVHHAVVYATKLYPNAYIIICIIGVIKGSASQHMRPLQRFVCGNRSWMPNQFLQPSFVTKASLLVSIVFILERKNYITAPHPVVYFGVVVFLVYFKLSSLLLGIPDPFAPFENLFCGVFMGGIWDAFKKATTTNEKKSDDDMKDLKNELFKNKQEKKND